MQELTAAGHLRVHALHCERPLSFPVTSRSGYQIPGLDMGRIDLMKYSHVLIMDVGSYPVQLTARSTTPSITEPPICPFNCSGNLVQQDSMCYANGCYCGNARGGIAFAL
jgi:hypothetical protein